MTTYVKVEDKNFHEYIPKGSEGIYFLHALDKNGRPIHLSRLLGIDKQGILYIGTTKGRTLSERLSDFRKTILPGYKGSGHIAGRKYNKLPVLQKAFPYNTLAFSFRICDNPPSEEDKEIESYKQRFGEKPPLNSM